MNLTTFNTKTKGIRPTIKNLVYFAAIKADRTIRPCHYTGSGKRISVVDNGPEVESLLNSLGLGYTTGNDAPRGGKIGDFIRLDDASMKRLAGVRKQVRTEKMISEAKAQAEKQAEQIAASERYAPIVGDHKTVLIEWWKSQAFHPVPEPVLAAKHATGMSWKEVRTFCKGAVLNA